MAWDFISNSKNEKIQPYYLNSELGHLPFLFLMSEKRPEDYTMELGPMGPIGEGAALMLRVNRNCPWNQCLFCPVYKKEKSSARRAGEIKGDIDKARRIGDLLESVSWDMGLNGWVRREVIDAVIRNHPEIYGDYPSGVTAEQLLAIRSLSNVGNWFRCGTQRVFLQDANALFAKPGDLIEVLRYLKNSFPTVDTVTAYARAKTCAQRSSEELRELHDAGLSWCFVGIESGCDEVLDYMKKGAKPKEHISGGQKLMASGIKMAAFVMPGLGGRNNELSQRHTRDTVAVLNEIKPTEVRVRSLAVLENAPLYARWESGEFQAPTEDQMVEELKALINGISFDCALETLQMTNVFTLKGQLPARKPSFLESINGYQAMGLLERARFIFNRYCHGGYLGFIQSWGRDDSGLMKKIEEAKGSLKRETPDALEKVERAVLAIKSKGIP
jgi:hypothetical protein